MSGYFETISRLVEYEVWCNLKAVDFLRELDEVEVQREFAFGLRTPHRTVSHIADVMTGWSGCVGPEIQAPRWPEYDEAETLEQIRVRLADTGSAWLRAMAESHRQGLLAEDRRLHQLFHLVTHGTHHRGQLLSMLSLMGYEHPYEGGDFGGWSNTPG